MTSNIQLIQTLKNRGVLKTPRIEEVMKSVDRGNFTKNKPYEDAPQPIGFNVTISAPHMHAIALEALNDYLIPGAVVLDIGSGSGYLTACMAKLVGSNGKAVGVDHVEELVNMSLENCKKDKSISSLLDTKVLEFYKANGRLGYSPRAPYNAIHVGASAAVIPDEIINQLKPGGRFIGPIGPSGSNQSLVQFDRLIDGKLIKKTLLGVRYGSLTDLKKQLCKF